MKICYVHQAINSNHDANDINLCIYCCNFFFPNMKFYLNHSELLSIVENNAHLKIREETITTKNKYCFIERMLNFYLEISIISAGVWSIIGSKVVCD